jgi:hypothetical protein
VTVSRLDVRIADDGDLWPDDRVGERRTGLRST